MKFPPDYPYSPPSIRFMTKVWHPNVYEVSKLTIHSFEEFAKESIYINIFTRLEEHVDNNFKR